ncbi:hypothetical protein E4T50_14631 [Aureobasidium sp. EXF-12298]|nr:hypothetical protein E4T50_14631 [Aureobasidium sp. EXF-12298]
MANLYAEYLPNIKTLTVTTVLDTPRNNTTALWLSNDRTKLVLEHDDRTYRITVPARLPGQGTQHLQLPNTGELQCVNRIPTVPIFGQEDPVILWSATSLDQDTRVHCKHCGTLVSSDKIHVWKDLPSEAWAEMMDLWHCHKPEEPESNPDDDAPAQKGYAAGSKLKAQVGVGLVDVMSFLLSEHDCTVEKECSVTTVASIRYRFDTKTQDQKRCSISEQTLGSAGWVARCIDIETHLTNGVYQYRPVENDDNIHQAHCKTCDTVLGHRDPQTEGVRLQKPYLALSSKNDSTKQSYDAAYWFSCYLNQAIESQGVRKFVFSTLPYEIWVFSTNLTYSSLGCPEPKQAMKVLFRAREGGQDVEMLRAANLLIETLTLSPNMEKLLYQVLQKENSKLPQSLKNFMGWEVAVLPLVQL